MLSQLHKVIAYCLTPSAQFLREHHPASVSKYLIGHVNHSDDA